MTEDTQPMPIEPPEDWCCQDSEDAGLGDDTEAANVEQAEPAEVVAPTAAPLEAS